MRPGEHRTNGIWMPALAVLGGCLLVTLVVSCRCGTRRCAVLNRISTRVGPAATLSYQVSYQEVKGAIPTVPGAEYVNDDACVRLATKRTPSRLRKTCIVATRAKLVMGRPAATWRPRAESLA